MPDTITSMDEDFHIILFMGPRKSGKDYYAARLRDTCFPAVTLAFADAIRETAATVCDLPSIVFLDRESKDKPLAVSGYPIDVHLEDELPIMVDGRKIDIISLSHPLIIHADMTPREALCLLVAGGPHIPEGYWSRLLIQRIKEKNVKNVIITDCRLSQEYQMVRESFTNVTLFHLEAWDRTETISNHITETSFAEIASLAKESNGNYHRFDPMCYPYDARDFIFAEMQSLIKASL